MTIRKLVASVFLLLSIFGGTANAKNHHKHAYRSAHSYSYRLDGRPSAWCGWQMRQWNGGGTEYNLASNWAHRGTPAVPGIGIVAVWQHHVAQIDGYDEKKHMWTVRQGNPYREHHPRSLAGVIAFRQL